MKTTNSGGAKRVAVGAKVLCNGYEGSIAEVCDGQLTGMVVVRLGAGKVCVDIEDLQWL